MEIKLTREKAIETLSHINSLLQKDNKMQLNYALIKNKRLMEKEVHTMYKSIDELEKARTEECIKYCTKDKDGKPVIVQGQYQGLQKGASDEFDKFVEDYNTKREAYLQGEQSFEIFGISKNLLPAVMNGVQQEALMPFIIDQAKK